MTAEHESQRLQTPSSSSVPLLSGMQAKGSEQKGKCPYRVEIALVEYVTIKTLMIQKTKSQVIRYIRSDKVMRPMTCKMEQQSGCVGNLSHI